MTASDATVRRVTDDLYELTRHLDTHGHEASHGLFGGEWGYGAEFSNTVFEMHPYWWGDCECGHELDETTWEERNPHAPTCYQAELERRDWEGAEELAAEWGLSRFGCAIHCTCGCDKRHQEWVAQHPHPGDCPAVRPNFRHHRTGVEVRWYKYLGRGMEIKGSLSAAAWRTVIAECISSVERQAAT